MDDRDPLVEHPAFDLLRERVPLSLLCDLGVGIDSDAVLAEEPADLSWLTPRSG